MMNRHLSCSNNCHSLVDMPVIIYEHLTLRASFPTPLSQIPSNITEETLRTLFAPHGTIVELHVVSKANGAGKTHTHLTLEVHGLLGTDSITYVIFVIGLEW